MSPAAEGAPGVGASDAEVEAGARALARLQIERNAAADGVRLDEERMQRCIGYSWPTYLDEARRVIHAARAAAPGPDRGEAAELAAWKAHPAHAQRTKAGVRLAISWLHARGHAMRDPHAKAVLDCAADHLGKAMSRDPSHPVDAVIAAALGEATNAAEDLRHRLAAAEARAERLQAELDRTREWSHLRAMDIVTLGQQVGAAEARASGLERERDEADRNYRMALSDMRRGGLCRSIYPETALGESLAAAHADLDEMRSRAERAEAVLRRIEWAGADWIAHDSGRLCPVCGGEPGLKAYGDQDHAPGCSLAEAINGTVIVLPGDAGRVVAAVDAVAARVGAGAREGVSQKSASDEVGKRDMSKADPSATMHHNQFATDVAAGGRAALVDHLDPVSGDVVRQDPETGRLVERMWAGRAVARRDALEEAAAYVRTMHRDDQTWVRGQIWENVRGRIAVAIRALIEQEPT